MKKPLTPNAKRLRSNSTEAEKYLWYVLRNKNLGVKFRRQAVIGQYIVDFVCFESKLVVEVDGGQHAQTKYDNARDQWLAREGFKILRFWNHDVLGNREGVGQKIAGHLKPPLPNPPHKGEGILDTGNQEQKVKAAFLICLIIFLFTPLYAAWQDNPKESIPLPHWTQEEHQRVMDAGGQDLKFTLYASSLSKKDLRGFYQNRLSNSGWQARDLAKEIKDLSAMKSAPSGLDNLLKETLYFTKGNLMLSINFGPPRPNSNKTYFSVTLGQIKEAEGRRAGLNPPYGLNGIPPNAELLPSSISVYPGAAQSISSPSTSHQTYGYVTNDGIDKVASFYKFDMPSRFNWSLVKESPIEKNSLDFSKDSRDCPACAKLPEHVRQAMGQAKISFIALKFKRGRETCLIGITQSESSARIGSEAEQTRITIVLTQDEKIKF